MRLPTLDEIDRELARRSLYEFLVQAWPHIEPGTPLVLNWHIRTLCDEVQAVLDGKSEKRRLCINVPPGSMKSTIVSVCAPAWRWITEPTRTSLHISGSGDVSMRDSMKCRNLILSDWYQGFSLSWTLAKDQDSKGWFRNTKGGERQATTIGSRGTGKRVHDIYIDDPNDTKDVSDLKLAQVTDAFSLTFQNRLKNMRTGNTFLIQQRTHMKDLTGYLLEVDPDSWRFVRIRQEFEANDPDKHEMDPRTEPGELLFPERFPTDVVEREKVLLGSVGYAGQHQQRPVPAGGAVFDISKLIYEEMARPGLRLCRGWDFAYTESKTADWTVGALCGMDERQEFWILDLVRQRTREQLELVDSIAHADGQMVETFYPTDPGGGTRNADDLARRLAGLRYDTWKPNKEKSTTWGPFAAHVRAGLVHVVRAGWNAQLRDEMQAAPRGLHDDILDAVTASFTKLAGQGRPQWSF